MPKIIISCLSVAVLAILLCGQPAVINAEPEKTEPIVIGFIGSITTFANYSSPYKNGLDLAVNEINTGGGVLGREIEIRQRDDRSRPEDAIRYVAEIADRDNATAIVSIMFSHTSLAIASLCEKYTISCIHAYAIADKVLGESWNPWIFRISANNSAIIRSLMSELTIPISRLALAMGQAEGPVSQAEVFKKELKALYPAVEVVAEYRTPFYKLDSGPVIVAINHAKPDAIFSSYVGSDQTKFVRDGKTRELFTNRVVITPRTAMRQDVGELLKEVPAGWISLCHSPTQITIPAYAPFRKAYLAKYEREPDEASVYGYSSIYAIKAAIEKAGNTDRASVRNALEGLTWGTPLGDVTFRKFDHQSNMPFFYGKTTGDGSGLPLCNDMKQADPWSYWPRPDDALPEILKARQVKK